MKEWNTDLYLKFEKERTLPAKDLVTQLNQQVFNRIMDLGCGPGNSTEAIVTMWPDAEIIGIDTSHAMLEKASLRIPKVQFTYADAGQDMTYLGKFDLIYSNSVIQWIPNHKQLIKRIHSSLHKGGIVALSIPNISTMPIQAAVDHAAQVFGIYQLPYRVFIHDLYAYYNYMAPLYSDFQAHEKHYFHVMPSHDSIIDWYSATGMRPYFEVLEKEDKINAFKQYVLDEIKKTYPKNDDGTVFFPFRRLFITAKAK